MFGRNADVRVKVDDLDMRLDALDRRQRDDRDLLAALRANDRAADPQQAHQTAILDDFQTAVRTNDEAARCLRHAEAVAAQAALALVEARKQMRRVAEGSI